MRLTPDSNASNTGVNEATALYAALQRERELRMRAEERVREQEDRFRSFVDSVADYAIYAIDTEGIVQSWNAGAQRMKGYAAEEIVGKSFSLFYTGKDRKLGRPEAAIREAREAGRFEGEGWRVRKDGGQFLANVILRPIVDGSGEVIGFSKVTRDLTETREAETKYQRILEAAPDAMVIVRRDGSIDYINAQAERMYGYGREEVRGKPVDMLVPTGSREAQAGFRDRLFLESHSASHLESSLESPEILGLRKDGISFPLEFSVSPLDRKDGQVLLFAVRDLTERRRAEARFRALLDSAPDAMVIVDREGRIVLANLQTEVLFGYARQELIGQSVDILMPQAIRAAHVAHRLDFFTEPTKREMGVGRELTAVRRNGSEFPVEISLSPLEGMDGISVTAAIRDISERKRTAQQLAEKMKELRHSNEALEQFAHIASHDLQEPLRMVASYTQLLSRRYKGRLDAVADEFIDFAVDGTQRMKRLVEDLLLYSRVGKAAPPVREFASEEALAAALQNLETTIREGRALVTHDPLPVIAGVEEQLVQVFQNLIGNAVKYHGRDAPCIHVSARRSDAEWIFSVADNGIGIDPLYFERIFVIFQRLHGRDEYEGTGVGLAICNRMMTQQGGRIWVESELGRGSVFYFSLPAR
jgi:PAS domain S-box-containing protein